jgi:hypothetical protein
MAVLQFAFVARVDALIVARIVYASGAGLALSFGADVFILRLCFLTAVCRCNL